MSRYLSVTFEYCVETTTHISKLFHHSSFFQYQTLQQYSDGPPPQWGHWMQIRYEKLWFSTIISLYLRNDMRWGHSYYGIPIGSHMQSILWWHFKWHLVTSNPDLDHNIFQCHIIWKRYKVELYLYLQRRTLQRQTNSKSYMIYRMAPFNDLEWPLNQISRSQHYLTLTLNVSELVNR